jgi:hypothetical protein
MQPGRTVQATSEQRGKEGGRVSEDQTPFYISESYTLHVEHSTVGLWYVKGSMHKGLFVIGHTLGEALGKVESVWADLQRVEGEERKGVA